MQMFRNCILLLGVFVENMVSGSMVDYQVGNPNKIYHSFPTHPREDQPNGPVRAAGECCMLYDHVKVPVGSSATFTSPNFPKSYPSDMICGWNFTTDPGYTFDMDCHFSHLKRDDYFTMWDQTYNLFSYIENVREKEVYHYFRSNAVQVGFHSDNEMSARGFECTIWPVKGNCDGVTESSTATAEETGLRYTRLVFDETSKLPFSGKSNPCMSGEFVQPQTQKEVDSYYSITLNSAVWYPVQFDPSTGALSEPFNPKFDWGTGYPLGEGRCLGLNSDFIFNIDCSTPLPRICIEHVSYCDAEDYICFEN